MEILYTYEYVQISIGALIFVSIFSGIIFGSAAGIRGSKFNLRIFIITLVIVAAGVFALFYCNGATKPETRYMGYITNWEEYCKNYETIKIQDKLVTAKDKD